MWPSQGSTTGVTPRVTQMPSLSYLHTKNGRHYVRIRIPQSLRPWLDQHEIRWSLHTGCLKTARQHLLIANVLINELFEQVHMEIAHAPLSDLEKIKIKNRIELIKREKLEHFRTLVDQRPLGITHAQQTLQDEQPDIAAFQSALDADHFDEGLVKGAASELIEVVPRLGYEFSALNPNYSYLAREFCKGMIWQHDAKAKLLQGLSLRNNHAPIIIQHFHGALTQKIDAVAASPAEENSSSSRISEMVAAYLDEQKDQGILAKTRLEYETVLNRFVDFTNNANVTDITGKDIKAFREALKNYPARLSAKQKTMKFSQLIGSGEQSRLLTSSIKKHLTRLSQLYHWAARNEFPVKADLADGYQLKDKRRDRDQRDRYDHEQINLIFSTPQFQGEKAFARAAYYWAPLISLYSGMRIEEICQLRTKDTRLDLDSGIPIFDVNDEDEDRKLKPGQSTARIIPIHPRLIELGLMSYVEDLRKAKHRMMFPTLSRHELNGYSHAVTKWFSEHKSALGFGNKHTFHSFRHTVADTLKQAGVEEAHLNAIMGHTGGSMSIVRYGKDYKPDVLLPIISKLNFDPKVKPYSACQLLPAEKRATLSAKFATDLKAKRLAARSSTGNE